MTDDIGSVKRARQATFRVDPAAQTCVKLRGPGFTSARKVKQMKKTVAWSIFLVLGQLNSTSRAQSQDDIAKQFAGMWRLVSNPQRLADGTTRQGSNRVAYVMFDTDAGHMCFVSMDPKRPRWKSETAPTPEERLSATGGFGAYCATVDPDDVSDTRRRYRRRR